MINIQEIIKDNHITTHHELQKYLYELTKGLHYYHYELWKRELIEQSATVFSGNTNDRAKIEELEKEKAALHQRIGQQTMELEFVKKNCKKLGLM